MSAKITELKSDIEELNDLLKLAKRKKVQDVLSLEIRKLETELISLKDKEESQKAAAAAADSAPTTSNAPSGSQKRYQIKLNGYGWDQSEKYVKVFVTLKNVQNVPKEQVYCKLTEHSMELHVDNLENKDYVLVINKLLEPIVVEDSHWKQKTDMVVIFLAKAQPNVKWSHMTSLEKKADDQHKNRFKTDDMMDKKDPQESIMSLMKNMYETGDDEMKRMISKAWYEGQQKKKTGIDSMEL
ncbi:calcyclin-binding protein [Cydia fagiglandana]|uniref:calcyclin-binding protein n=1 Tax=Cydia fagiglandana TaxID=1458189 RepID=UPI002FEE40D3